MSSNLTIGKYYTHKYSEKDLIERVLLNLIGLYLIQISEIILSYD